MKHQLKLIYTSELISTVWRQYLRDVRLETCWLTSWHIIKHHCTIHHMFNLQLYELSGNTGYHDMWQLLLVSSCWLTQLTGLWCSNSNISYFSFF
jgi:hypothetical protein